MYVSAFARMTRYETHQTQSQPCPCCSPPLCILGHTLQPAVEGSPSPCAAQLCTASSHAHSCTCMPLVQGELSQLEQYEGAENEAPDNLYGGKSQTIQAAGNGAWARGKLAESTPRNDAFLLRQWLQVGPCSAGFNPTS